MWVTFRTIAVFCGPDRTRCRLPTVSIARSPRWFLRRAIRQASRPLDRVLRCLTPLSAQARARTPSRDRDRCTRREVSLLGFLLPRDRALPLADLPQPPRGLRVLCLRARRPLLLVEEVSPAHIGNIRRGCEPHKGVCALLRAARHRLEDRHP